MWQNLGAFWCAKLYGDKKAKREDLVKNFARDPQLRALRQLLTTKFDLNEKLEIQKHIEARLKELKNIK